MKTSKNKRTWIAFIVLIVVCFLVGVGYFFYKSNRTFEYNGKWYHAGESFKDAEGCNTCSFDENGQMMCTTMACNIENPSTIEILFTYTNGEYSYSGTIQKPTPCHEVKYDYVVRESYPEQVDLRFTIEDSGEICSQVIDQEEISGKIPVSEKARIQVYVNDELQTDKGINE